MPAKGKRNQTAKPDRIVPYSKEWEKAADRLARDFCTAILPCRKCNMPVISGYCCNSCGSFEP